MVRDFGVKWSFSDHKGSLHYLFKNLFYLFLGYKQTHYKSNFDKLSRTKYQRWFIVRLTSVYFVAFLACDFDMMGGGSNKNQARCKGVE